MALCWTNQKPGGFLAVTGAFQEGYPGSDSGFDEYGRLEPLFNFDRSYWNFDNGPPGAL